MTAIAVVTTVGSKKEARAMACALVNDRLVACAQISKIESVYVWKKKVESGKEYRLLLKTMQAKYPDLERRIRELHSYELPAIHAFAFAEIEPAYAQWIEDNAS